MANNKCDMFFKNCCNNEGSFENANIRKQSVGNLNNGINKIEKSPSQQGGASTSYQNYNEAVGHTYNNISANGYYTGPCEEHYSQAAGKMYVESRTQETQPAYESYSYAQNNSPNYPPSYVQKETPNYLLKDTQSYIPNNAPSYNANYSANYSANYDTNYASHYEQLIAQNYTQNYGGNQASNYEKMHKEKQEGVVPTINVKADQPIFNVPVYQDKYLRDRIIEVPKYEVQDIVQPKVYTQETKHDIPTIELIYKEKPINIPQHKILEKPVEVDVPIGYAPVYAPKWDIREVPRPVPKYEGEQKIIEVDVPQIKYIDKYVEKEIVVDIKEKIIPKITEIEKPIDIVKYEWKEEYQDVPVYKYVPKIDVELDCPPPLIVPYPDAHFQNTAHIVNPNQTAADIPPEVLLKNMNLSKFANAHVNECMKQNLLEIARSAVPQKAEKKEKKSWFFWKNKKNDNEEDNSGKDEIDPETGYPKSMPKDFAHFFKKDLNSVKKQMAEFSDKKKGTGKDGMINMNNFGKSPVTPTVEYLGKVDKAPIEGGKLDGISFKLHAIEVHQFIPVPTLDKPKFLDLVPPEKIENNDISGLENVFGTVPDGWVDPNITGFIAPMMNDVLHGNMQPKSPLLNKLSIGNISQKKKSFAHTSEDHRSMYRDMANENFSLNNSMSYNNQ